MARHKDPSLEGKTEQINTRVSPATREALQAAANARPDRSLSREIEERLTESLARDDAGNQGENRFSREIEELLGTLRFAIERVEYMTVQSWWADGFARDATARAAFGLICSMGPRVAYGKSEPPEAVRLLGSTAEQVGDYAARMTIAAKNLPPGTELGRAGPSFPQERIPGRLAALIRWDDPDKETGQ